MITPPNNSKPWNLNATSPHTVTQRNPTYMRLHPANLSHNVTLEPTNQPMSVSQYTSSNQPTSLRPSPHLKSIFNLPSQALRVPSPKFQAPSPKLSSRAVKQICKQLRFEVLYPLCFLLHAEYLISISILIFMSIFIPP